MLVGQDLGGSEDSEWGQGWEESRDLEELEALGDWWVSQESQDLAESQRAWQGLG